MSDPLKTDKVCSERLRAQRREAAAVIGIDDAYLLRLVHFFVARVRADKTLGRFYTVEDEEHRTRQVTQMTSFWLSTGLGTDDYVGDLVAVHRKLPGLTPEDFDRWLVLFRASLDETAPTVEAARYLMIRAERVAEYLKAELFEGPGDAGRD
ncbi:MAG TPA: group III truncated hemoglobin [Roseovarius sp.]